MDTTAVRTQIVQKLKAKSAWAREQEQALLDIPRPASAGGRALLHGQVEYVAGKAAAYDEAIELVEDRLRVEGAVPLCGPPLDEQWTPGERVEEVIHHGPYGPANFRAGVVVAIDEELVRHQHLRVRFDDGEERQINPDVMRHREVV